MALSLILLELWPSYHGVVSKNGILQYLCLWTTDPPAPASSSQLQPTPFSSTSSPDPSAPASSSQLQSAPASSSSSPDPSAPSCSSRLLESQITWRISHSSGRLFWSTLGHIRRSGEGGAHTTIPPRGTTKTAARLHGAFLELALRPRYIDVNSKINTFMIEYKKQERVF